MIPSINTTGMASGRINSAAAWSSANVDIRWR